MLRVSTTDTADEQRIVVEGELASRYVAELDSEG